MRRRTPRRCRATLEAMEDRVCLASSVGWDGPGRGTASLTYYIGSAPSSLSQSVVNSALKAALNVWAKVAAIKFTQTSQPGRADSIDFTFRPIDGRGGTLAEGHYPDDVNTPRIAGDIQFDSAERWEVGNGQGSAAFDLVLTAVHEIGHALGLDHSRVPGSVMAPTISPNQKFTGLSASDVTAIQKVYARPGTSTVAARATASSATQAAIAEAPTATPTFPWLSWAWRPRTAGATIT